MTVPGLTVPGLPGLPKLDGAAFAYPAAEIRKLADQWAAVSGSVPFRAMLADLAAIRSAG